MTKPTGRRTVRKAADTSDPGSYAESDITPEDRKRGKDAKRQAASGTNPPSWAVDESIWERAKEAADQTYDEGDDAYWPAVVHIYGNMGGEIQSKKAMQPKGKMKMVAGMMADMDMDAEMMSAAADMDMKRVEELMRGDDEPTDDEVSAMMSAMKSKAKKVGKAEHHHADMADVVEMMSEYGMSEADMVEASGLDADRVKALFHEGEKPTDAELDAMMHACEECEEKVEKHGDHDQSSHGDRGFSSTGSVAGNMADRLAEKYPAAARSLRDASDALRAAHDHEVKGDKSKVKEQSRQAMRSLREARTAFRGTGSGNDDEVDRMISDVKEYTASIGKSVSSESLLKAELGMSDGEFRRMLSQAVYARWGKQAAVDEIFPEMQVAVIKAWEGEVWMSGFRLISVPYDAEDGTVTLGEVQGEVRQTYEPVAKSADVEPDNSPCEVEYVADRTRNGEYVIGGLNGEAVTLAKSLSDAGVRARVEGGADGEHRVVFASRGAVCKQLAVRATVEGEFDASDNSRSFVPFLCDEVSLHKAEEKGIVYAVVYEPDVVDRQGEWATADDIEEAAHEYLKRSRRMKRQHEDATDSEVVESYVAQADFLLGNRVVRKGSWVIAVKLGETAKKLYKAGKLTGVSMGGTASVAA